MNKFLILTIPLLIISTAFLTSLTQAAYITPHSVTGTGSYNNSPDLIIDGNIPDERTSWTDSSNVWWDGTTPTFTIDLGDIYIIEDITLQVDNNDNYRVQYSLNNSVWNTLFTIDSGFGDVDWGMDTMTTISGDSKYISEIDFSSPVNARYIRIFATGGDNKYAVSELDAYGTLVPEPISSILFVTGGTFLVGIRYLKKRKV
jgi:hypothetical protein